MPATARQPRKSKKLQQYLDDWNDLNEHYQYQPIARLRFSADGITPYISVEEVPPERKKTKKNGELKKEKK